MLIFIETNTKFLNSRIVQLTSDQYLKSFDLKLTGSGNKISYGYLKNTSLQTNLRFYHINLSI